MSVNTTNFVSGGFNIRPYVKMSFSVHIPHHRCSNVVGKKCLSLSLCAFHAEDSLFEEKIGAIHIIGFTKLDFS